ncbi:MAG: hypothetical protein HKL95_11415 [Phycisphaerae bacterium]|nr:hypothetical protein [Phycisphaerae bacterium]
MRAAVLGGWLAVAPIGCGKKLQTAINVRAAWRVGPWTAVCPVAARPM